MLLNMYGPGVDRMTTEKRCINTTSSKQTIEIDVRVSNYHIEIEPSDVGANDRYVVQDVIKDMANNGSIAAVLMNSSVTHKTIVLNGAGNITKQAQAGLRRTMETFSGSCRLILVCTYSSRVIEPLRSRCVLVRVPLPSKEALRIALKEYDTELVEKIVESSGRSISRAMFMAKERNCKKIVWEKYIVSICSGVFLEQSPRKLLDVCESLNELLLAGVPSSIILKTLMYQLIQNDNLKAVDGVKREIVRWAAVYEHRLSVGSRDIVHLEAFVATFMDIYRKHTVNQFV